MTSPSKQIDAIKGVRHLTEEKLFVEKMLVPYGKYAPAEEPNKLSVRVMNFDPGRTYIVRIYEVVESVKMPRQKEKK